MNILKLVYSIVTIIFCNSCITKKQASYTSICKDIYISIDQLKSLNDSTLSVGFYLCNHSDVSVELNRDHMFIVAMDIDVLTHMNFSDTFNIHFDRKINLTPVDSIFCTATFKTNMVINKNFNYSINTILNENRLGECWVYSNLKSIQ